ncbi:hypothetical protein [Nocardioides sp. cx-173]|uniref:hypothetical protein n=1 Tax=Nocardioides sp. cx-173 TaxID=2898796 RepID=UPI001E62F4EC|nr:hypothetical protein [Nocardioides sp. cx-173]MCD4526851.1 hypothetical protein [Nocardioides sp. cx-173]UGB43952.1 hypothetical protein LQ940_10645 [Nocardioides sp. cx-173]
MTLSPLRSLSTTLALTVASGVLVGLTQSPASAAWSTVTNVHGAKLQTCRTANGAAVRLRVNNWQGKHAHRGGLFRKRGGKTVYYGVVAQKGRLSPTRQMPVQAGDSLGTLVGEINGPAAGGGVPLSMIPRC